MGSWREQCHQKNWGEGKSDLNFSFWLLAIVKIISFVKGKTQRHSVHLSRSKASWQEQQRSFSINPCVFRDSLHYMEGKSNKGERSGINIIVPYLWKAACHARPGRNSRIEAVPAPVSFSSRWWHRLRIGKPRRISFVLRVRGVYGISSCSLVTDRNGYIKSTLKSALLFWHQVGKFWGKVDGGVKVVSVLALWTAHFSP